MKIVLTSAASGAIGAVVGGWIMTGWQAYAHVISAACWVFTQ